jgi:hypothetical protein
MLGCYPVVSCVHRVSQISDEKCTNKHADNMVVQGSSNFLFLGGFEREELQIYLFFLR